MKVREVMTADPVCRVASHAPQKVARILRDENVGSVPVVDNQQSNKIAGVITDRDLCCEVIADGLDPKTTTIERFIGDPPRWGEPGEL
jgi:CBS domain-containing protein